MPTLSRPSSPWKILRFTRVVSLFAALATVCAAAEPRVNPVGIDFSYAGYEGGGHVLPFVRAAISVRPSGGDDTGLLQTAIDHVASLPVGANGFRGTVLLRPGRFHVAGQIRLRASGVVLRGSGSGAGGTVIVAEGTGRRTLIEVGGDAAPALDAATEITDDLVAAGSRKVHVASISGLRVGSRIVVRRPSTAEWIKAHGMSGLLGTFADQRWIGSRARMT